MRLTNKAGFILFIALGISAVLIILIIPLINWAMNEYNWTTRSYHALRALNLADAGAELAVWDIVHNNALFTGWSGGNPQTRVVNSFTDNWGNVIGDIAVSCDNTAPDEYVITAQGFSPTMTNPLMTKTVKVEVFPHPLFNNGIFAQTAAYLHGNATTDSYDSSIGPYDPSNPGTNGDIGTNGTLTFADSALVNGDAFIGPSGTVVGDIPTHVSGEDYYCGNEVEGDDWPFNLSYFISLPSQGNIVIGGSTLVTVPSGDWRYESVQVDGKAKLSISANTRVYVHNDVYVAGLTGVIETGANVEIYIGGNADIAGQGIVNLTGTPSDLLMYGVGSGSTLSYTGNSDYYGTIYAPESTVYMSGNANIYGALVGDTVELAGNIAFHFDEALLHDGPHVGYEISYWQED